MLHKTYPTGSKSAHFSRNCFEESCLAAAFGREGENLIYYELRKGGGGEEKYSVG